MPTVPVLLVTAVGLWWPMTGSTQPVPAGYQHIAAEFGVPPGLLYAVALTESGQSSLSGGQFRPWPWTLNIDGKGHYYLSRRQAWAALKEVLAHSEASVDIGLMQVNWRYHHTDLGSPWQALEPYHNLRVAAAILNQCFTRHGAWLPSAGCYHAPHHPDRAQHYSQRVQRHWPSAAPVAREARP